MNTTILIKTFERPEACQRLIYSIRKFYPDIQIVVVDDSREVFNFKQVNVQLSTVFDIGVSAGRNLGLKNVNTPFVFICDDDCVFTEKTDLKRAEWLLLDKQLDILGVAIPGLDYCGSFEQTGDVVKYTRSGVKVGDVTFYDFVPNTFLAKTNSLRTHPWDEELKMGEHFAFFHRYKGQLSVGFTSDISIDHIHMGNPTYDPFRKRAIDYLKLYLKKAGIKTRTDLYGETIHS